MARHASSADVPWVIQVAKRLCAYVWEPRNVIISSIAISQAQAAIFITLPHMSERQRFRNQIIASFSMEELETLCRDLGVDPDVIPYKEKGKDIWTDQIIAYFERHSEIAALLSALRHQRSEQTWTYTPPSVEPPDVLRKLPIGLIAGSAALVALVLIGGLVLSRQPATQTTATNAALTAATTAQSTARPVDTPDAMPVASSTQLNPTARPTVTASHTSGDLPVLTTILDLSDSCPGRLETGPDPMKAVQLRLIVDAGYIAYLHGDDISMSSGETLTSTLVSVFGPYDAVVTVRNGVFCAPVPAISTQADQTRIDMQNECDGCPTMEIRHEEKQP